MKKGVLFKFINVIAILAVFGASFFIGNTIAGIRDQKGKPVKVEAGENEEKGMPVDRLNVLLLGVDARKGEKDARSDTMVLVSVDRETNKIAMLSIPRDTFVDIPGYGKSKINAAHAIGGSDLAVDVVEDLLDVEIPYYVTTNFEGFQDIVDTLGGVTIDVEKRMYYPDGNRTINLKKGVQRLDGKKALQYVRYRHDALGDITRTERQQKFLAALADELLQAKTIVKLPKLLPQIFDVVETNFGLKDAFFLTKVASSLKAENIVAQTLPGTFYNYKGISYWKANEEKTKLVLEDMFKGVTTAAVIDQPISVPKEKPKTEVKPQETDVSSEETSKADGLNRLPVDIDTEQKGDKENSGEDSYSDDINAGQPPANGGTGDTDGMDSSGGNNQPETSNPPGTNNSQGTTDPPAKSNSPVTTNPGDETTSGDKGHTGSRSSTGGEQSQTVIDPVYSGTGNV